MHSYLLSIGSNTYAKARIERVKRILLKHFPDIYFTSTVESKPHGSNYKRSFVNMLGMIQSDLNTTEINSCLKEIEKQMGRRSEHKSKGKVVIDLDLIRMDDLILRTKDYNSDYVQFLLPETKL